MTISQRIFLLLKQKGKKQKELAEYTGISTSAISAWNKNNTNPAAESLSTIADFLEVSLDYLLTGKEKIIEYTKDIEKLLNNYNIVDDISKQLIQERAETLAVLATKRASKERAADQSQKLAKAADELPDDEPEQEDEFYIDLCSLPASAGEGVQLDEGYTEPMQIKHTYIAERANYAVRVSGDSMETEYYDGDIVLVETCPDVNIGEIGIFIVNDQGYIKQRGEDRLISLNPEYDDVFIQEGDVVSCRGRVLGKAELVK